MRGALVAVAILTVVLALCVAVLSEHMRGLEATFEHSVAETSWRISSLEAQVERLLEEGQ